MMCQNSDKINPSSVLSNGIAPHFLLPWEQYVVRREMNSVS